MEEGVETDVLTPKPFLKAGRSVHVLPSRTYPDGPAPPIIASEIMVIKKNSRTLTKEPKYSSQPKYLLGTKNTAKQKTRNIVTTSVVSRCRASNLEADSRKAASGMAPEDQKPTKSTKKVASDANTDVHPGNRASSEERSENPSACLLT